MEDRTMYSITNPYKKVVKVGDKEITLEYGKFSEQTNAAVLATCGETVVHATVVAGGESSLDYFPLQVEYVEKLYAGGRIKGSRWVKREGRPTDEAILKGRLIDRVIRPLFPEGLKNEVQAVATVLSADSVNDPDIIAMIAVSAALAISDIPWEGPIAGVRMGYKAETGEFMINPTYEARELSDMDLVVAGSKDAIVMVEAGANEVPEETIVNAFEKAQQEIAQVVTAIDEMRTEIGKEKFSFTPAVPNEALLSFLQSNYGDKIQEFIDLEAVLKPTGMGDVIKAIVEKDETFTAKELQEGFHELMKNQARKRMIGEKIRPDGRDLKQIREITCMVDLLPRTHGSAMFKRGATQVLSVVTLGSPALGQMIEDMEGNEEKHYIHHYNMPPYASGEPGRIGSPKRREIGHGALAERALQPMIPDQKDFPYTIHVVSEVMSSNGSTSQASVCGSTMALMSAGVPIKKPVAGIAMGLISNGTDYVVLSDIQGLEDHIGDMDFKVAGTADGITALQMDIKIKGLTLDIMRQALAQAHEGRMFILGKMLAAISEPKKQLSQYAPKIVQLQIPYDRIGELIGPGGKTIKNIIAQTGAEVDVESDDENKVGLVNISSTDADKLQKAQSWISGMMRDVEVGEEFDGIVVRIEKFGAFVEFLPGKDGLVHVSRMSTEYVADPHSIVQIGDTVHVRLFEIDEAGRFNLSMLTPEQEEQVKQEQAQRKAERGDRGGDRGGFGGGRPNFNRGERRFNDRGGFRSDKNNDR